MKKVGWLLGVCCLLGMLSVGCGNPCETLVQRCNQCQDKIDEDRCKSVFAFNNWGQCGALLDEFTEKNVCPLPTPATEEGS